MSSSINNNNNKSLDLVAHIDGKTQQIEIPQYALKYPSLNRVPLAAVKTSIYNPDLTSIHKFQVENFLGKFAIDCSKTSTTLTNDRFDYTGKNKTNFNYPIKLVGNVEESAKSFYKPNFELPRSLSLASFDTNKNEFKRENTQITENVELIPQFRFNRTRFLQSDRPNHGRLPARFSTNPTLDQFGLRVGAQTAFNHRQNDGFKYTNSYRTKALRP